MMAMVHTKYNVNQTISIMVCPVTGIEGNISVLNERKYIIFRVLYKYMWCIYKESRVRQAITKRPATLLSIEKYTI